MFEIANRSNTLNSQPSTFRKAAGLQSGSLSQGSGLSVKPARFQNRSSNQSTPLSSSRRTAKNTLLAIFSGRSPQVTGVGGSGARSLTQSWHG
jgi:hypothetical protein